TRYTVLAENINTEFSVPKGTNQAHLATFATSQPSRRARRGSAGRLQSWRRAGGFRAAPGLPGEARRFRFHERSGLPSFVPERRRRGTYRRGPGLHPHAVLTD